MISFASSLAFSTTTLALPTLNISQVPLQLVTPGRAQVLIAVANSQSMDSTLSGAIMTGSGILPSNLNSLYNSSSPVNYAVPAGFTPPVQAADASGNAPFTVNQSGTLIDNSASRLNLAKESIQAVLQAYMQNTDFALANYSNSAAKLFTTMVYYMSPSNGSFTFTNTPVSGNRYVINPCFNYLTASSTVQSNCAAIATLYSTAGTNPLNTNQYMQISASSDDADIHDVFYNVGSFPGIFVAYNGPNPVSPYPPYFSINDYNNNNVSLQYNNTLPNVSQFGAKPTSAGFIPFSPQVMYAQRGFGYGYAFAGGNAATKSDIVVSMTTAGDNPTASSVTAAINNFLPFLQSETNNSSTNEIKSVAGVSPIAGLLTTAQNYLTSLKSGSSTNTCPPRKSILLISDGLPTLDLNLKSWPPLGSSSAAGYGVTAVFNSDGSLGTTNDQALTDTINALTNLNTIGIKTFIVGLGAPFLNSQVPATLKAMAIAGGTTDFYSVSSPVDLVNQLNNILISVQNGSITTTAAVVSSYNLQKGTVEYQASFNPNTAPYLDWTGDLVEIALDPSTGVPTGTTQWSAQTLNAVFSKLYNLTLPVYNQSHLLYVDGSPHSSDVQFSDGSWHTLLVGGEGGGGNSIYALDITNPQNITSENNLVNAVLWEFTDSDMGLSYSEPQIGPVNPGSTTLQSFAVFFGNGYNSQNNKAILYAVDPKTGIAISKIDLCSAVPGTCNTSLPQGLSTVTLATRDGLQGQPIAQVYAGDLQGNLWAVDVSSTVPAQWKARLLFQARDVNNNPQPITTAPVVTLPPTYPQLQGLFVMFGTGQLLTTNDLTNQQQQTIYGVWDKPGAGISFTRSNLQSQTLSIVPAATSGLSTDILINSNNAVNWRGSTVGWFVDLVIPGQRVVTNPQLLNGAFITTLNTPPVNTCTAGFSSMLLELNYLTGGAFPRPQLDINGSGTITTSDQYNGVYPSGFSLAPGFASSPTILGPNVNNNMIKIVTQSSGKQRTIINPNNSPRLTGWWQIQ